jgi:hypothetical protein
MTRWTLADLEDRGIVRRPPLPPRVAAWRRVLQGAAEFVVIAVIVFAFFVALSARP